jgi:hypothetical protein
MTDEPAAHLNWTTSIDIFLAKWCDQAKAFEWMHTESFGYYDRRARTILITSNVLTAINGLTNVIAGGYTINGIQLAWIFGSMSILVSITNMLQEKLGYATKAAEQSHSAKQWTTIRRKIEEILSIPPTSRKDCAAVMKYLRQDINGVDGALNIPEHIKQTCYEKFNAIPEFDLPDICGKVEHTIIYTEPLLR